MQFDYCSQGALFMSPLSANFLSLSLMISLILPATAAAVRIGDFELSPEQASIPLQEIHSGGPAKDGIPAIDNPRFVQSGRSLRLSRNRGFSG